MVFCCSLFCFLFFVLCFIVCLVFFFFFCFLLYLYMSCAGLTTQFYWLPRLLHFSILNYPIQPKLTFQNSVLSHASYETDYKVSSIHLVVNISDQSVQIDETPLPLYLRTWDFFQFIFLSWLLYPQWNLPVLFPCRHFYSHFSRNETKQLQLK